MVRIFSLWVALSTLLMASSACAAPAQDSGVIQIIFASGETMAVKLVAGYPNGSAASLCNPGLTYWAGADGLTPAMKALLLTAKANGSTVYIDTDGCTASGGAWLKITGVYIG